MRTPVSRSSDRGIYKRMNEGVTFDFCDERGYQHAPGKDRRAHPAKADGLDGVELQRCTSEQPTRFAQAVFRIRTYNDVRETRPAACFIIGHNREEVGCTGLGNAVIGGQRLSRLGLSPTLLKNDGHGALCPICVLTSQRDDGHAALCPSYSPTRRDKV